MNDPKWQYNKTGSWDTQWVHTVEIGADQVVIDKLLGPTIFAMIRVTADLNRGGWVIERQRIDNNEWEEQMVVDAQRAEEFED